MAHERSLDGSDQRRQRCRLRWLAAPQIVDEVVAQRGSGRIVEQVHLLQRVVDEVIELTLGPVMTGARPLDRAHEAIAGDRSEMDLDPKER